MFDPMAAAGSLESAHSTLRMYWSPWLRESWRQWKPKNVSTLSSGSGTGVPRRYAVLKPVPVQGDFEAQSCHQAAKRCVLETFIINPATIDISSLSLAKVRPKVLKKIRRKLGTTSEAPARLNHPI